jgi:purine-nucleoside phosphorylase
MNINVGASLLSPAQCESAMRSGQPAKRNEASGADELSGQIAAAVDFILDRRLLQPQVAIILGSGLGSLAGDVRHGTSIPYRDIPHFETTHADGHAGQLILGYLAGVPVVVMQGRYHRYEGHSCAAVCFPVRVMQALGASTLLVTNAAGGLNPRFRAGDLMLVDQHINCLWPRNQHAASGHAPAPGQLRYCDNVYDSDLLERMRRIALRSELSMHRGTYIATLGPTYETRSEYRMFRWMGGDAVGMSTVPEALTARELSMRVLAISVITNVACTDAGHGTTHAEVVQCGQQVEPRLRHLVHQLLEEMAGPAD